MANKQNYPGLEVVKTIGSEGNLLVKDCPVLIPKENAKIFSDFQKACQDS